MYRYRVSEIASSKDQFTVISLIHVTDVRSEDLSTYNCTASSDLGVVSVIIYLHEQGLPSSLSICLLVCTP